MKQEKIHDKEYAEIQKRINEKRKILWIKPDPRNYIK